MDWFLSDNCLRHERVNIAGNFFTNLMNFILKEEDVEYYKHDRNIPVYEYTVPDLSTILRICFNGDVSPTVVAKKQPIRMNETMTFVLNQSQVDIKHPFDLDVDQIGGAFIKNDKVRFYE